MAAKNCCLSLLKDNRTKFVDRDVRSTETGTYSNVNLNSINKYSHDVSMKINKDDISTDKSVKFRRSSLMDNWSGQERKLDRSNYLIPCSPTSYPEAYIDEKENEHRRLKGGKNTNNNSTLLLHISAYENFMEPLCTTDNSKILSNNESKFKNVPSSEAMYQNLFDFPRQQEDMIKEIEENKPEIMLFKATQQMLAPNQSTPVKRMPSATVATEKNKDGVDTMNGTTVSNPFHGMPSELNLDAVLSTPKSCNPSSSFKWNIEQQSLLFPAKIDSNFMYDSPVNSEYDSRSQSFWQQQSIAPSPARQPYPTLHFSVESSVNHVTKSTQTDITIPINFDLTTILGDIASGMNCSLSGRASLNSESISAQSSSNSDLRQHRQPYYDLGEECHQLNMLKIDEISPINSTYSEDQ